MAATNLGYPYPVGTDPTSQGDDAIKALAEASDTKAGISAGGKGTVVVSSINNPFTLSVTFPAGRFAVAPSVVVGGNASNPERFSSSVNNVTASGFTAVVTRNTGTANTDFYWNALQAD